MRLPHPLTATKRNVVPRRMIFLDSEARTDVEISESEIDRALEGQKVTKEHDPYLICANFFERKKGDKYVHRYRDYHEGNFLASFWEDVDRYARSNGRTYLFAHNAKYDIQVTAGVHHLVRLGYRVVGFNADNPFILRLVKEVTHSKAGVEYTRIDEDTGLEYPAPRRKTLIILSSTNFYAQSLKSLGDIFKLPKLDFEHGREIDMSNPQDREDAITYCRRDVEILTKAIVSFLEFIAREDLGPFGMTVAGQAFTAFRHRFIREGQIMIHSNPMALEVERRAYAGGRNECFRLGRIPDEITVCDINSMYPYVMKEKLYPTKLVTHWRTATIEQVIGAIQDDYLIVCDARVTTDEPIYHVKKDRLIFPVGDFWTALTTPELLEGFSRGIITEVKNVCLYEPGNIFEAYVSFFYQSRLEAKAAGDAVHDHLFKIFLNSLYGKFGQKNANWDLVDEADPEEIGMYHVYNHSTGEHDWYKVFGGGVFLKNNDEDDMEAFNSFPAIAAHVTGYARMLIWEVMEAAGRENVYYTDTDSVFVNDTGYRNLERRGYIDPKRLGALKKEKVGRLWLNGCKDYLFLEKLSRLRVKKEYAKGGGRTYPKRVRPATHFWKKEIKIKGVPKNAVPLQSEDGVQRYAVTQWGGFSDRFRSGDFEKFWNKVIIKELKREYTKANVDGVNVTPFRLDYVSEQREESRKVIELARKEAAASLQVDMIQELCRKYGFIRVLTPGQRHFSEYQELPKSAKVKYFRLNGVPLDIWADDNGFTVGELFDYLRG